MSYINKILLLIGIALSCNLAKGQINPSDTARAVDVPLTTTSFSSANKHYKYSVGVKVFSMQQFPRILKQENYTDFKDLTFNSIFLKTNDNQINYRFIATYFNNSVSFENECAGCEIVTGKLSDFSIRTGFEKVLSYATIQPYFGFDIGFRKNRFKGSSENATSTPFSTPYNVVAEKNAGLLSPLLGVNFNLINHFTVGVETSMEMMFNYERQEKTTKSEAREQSFRNNKSWEFLLRPIAVTLQYNFGQAD